MKNYVFCFGGKNTAGRASQRLLLGGKGANLAEMAREGIPVPPGFTISTEACRYYYENERQFPASFQEAVLQALEELEDFTAKGFGDRHNPLLVSVRSGSSVSMPGMMDTILNLGINDAVVEGLAQKTQNDWFAYDCYRRFIQMYADVVLNVKKKKFERIIDEIKESRGITQDNQMAVEDLHGLIRRFKECVLEATGASFPQDPREQLWMAVRAVFESWMNERSVFYRQVNHIDHKLGTAVNVQSMVFGNMGDRSATGVAFTRNPSTGEKKYYGEYLINAQGEDVVAGIRTPQPIVGGAESLQCKMPKTYDQLRQVFEQLENHYKDVQDIEFTVEEEKLWILQTRNAKRTAAAAVKVAYDMVEEKKMTAAEAIMKIDASSVNQLLHPQLDPAEERKILGKGLPASPGAASGKVAFSYAKVMEFSQEHEKSILVRVETSPEDVQGIYNSAGILTARGGMTSHAAVVARGAGKPCVSGVLALDIHEEKGHCRLGEKVLREGDFLTIDGTLGDVIDGVHPTIEAVLSKEFEAVLRWADGIRSLEVRANAETYVDAKKALDFGAEGIGLCRTEHMFFAEDRINWVREMILAEDAEQRQKALDKLLPVQQGDFEELFELMGDKPVTIRLLDPPLHEFLPHTKEEMEALAKSSAYSVEYICQRAAVLEERNPMLGHRGCRLAISYPEIYTMQMEAIFNAAYENYKKTGKDIRLEVMIPLVGTVSEVDYIRQSLETLRSGKEEEFRYEFRHSWGSMIEVPRAVIRAREIAQSLDFFSFGTNDLTQMVYGLSRDDAGFFLEEYIQKDIYDFDPFFRLDQKGVGELINLGVRRGREGNPNLKLGICGEHGGQPDSIDFFHRAGLDYVSCSPYRIPVARIAAAQAKLRSDAA